MNAGYKINTTTHWLVADSETGQRLREHYPSTTRNCQPADGVFKRTFHCFINSAASGQWGTGKITNSMNMSEQPGQKQCDMGVPGWLSWLRI